MTSATQDLTAIDLADIAAIADLDAYTLGEIAEYRVAIRDEEDGGSNPFRNARLLAAAMDALHALANA